MNNKTMNNKTNFENVNSCLQLKLDLHKYCIEIPKRNLVYKKNNCIPIENTFNHSERTRWEAAGGVGKEDEEEIILEVDSIRIGNCSVSKYKNKYIKNNKGKYVWKQSKKSIIENLKTKHYLEIGTECAICLDQINHKKDALLTDCGHSFHYSCIQKNDESNYNMMGDCPLCRQSAGDYMELKNIYINTDSSKNGLDKLENFWDSIETEIPEKCYKDWEYYEDIHDLGFNKNCKSCKKYRKTGKKC
jgi:hypothetical protein